MIIEKFRTINHKFDKKSTGSIEIKNKIYNVKFKDDKVILSLGNSTNTFFTNDVYIDDNMTIKSSRDQNTISLSVSENCKIIIQFFS
jgi:hypothetical protein